MLFGCCFHLHNDFLLNVHFEVYASWYCYSPVSWNQWNSRTRFNHWCQWRDDVSLINVSPINMSQHAPVNMPLINMALIIVAGISYFKYFQCHGHWQYVPEQRVPEQCVPNLGRGEADVCFDMLCYSRTVEARDQACRVAIVIIVHRLVAVQVRDTSARDNTSKSSRLMTPVRMFRETLFRDNSSRHRQEFVNYPFICSSTQSVRATPYAAFFRQITR